MPITFTYEKKDENGNKYTVDENGNRIEEENEEYRYLNKEYVDYVNSLTEEDLARQRAEGEARVEARRLEKIRLASPFLMNVLDKPEAPQPRLPLWGNYWSEREFCIVAGDAGVGKSLLALQVARQLATPVQQAESNRQHEPKKVLYIDFELDTEGYWMRYGADGNTNNIFWAGFNAHASMPNSIADQTEWLLNSLEKYIEETQSEVLIIDQIDRLQIPIGKRLAFLYKLKALTRKYALSTMLVLNTRARNFSKGVELHHIHQSKLYLPLADSVVAIAADYNDETTRYIKPLKMRNRSLNHRAELECFSVINDDEKLSLYFTAMHPEEVLLKKNKTQLRQEKILTAEALRKDGMTYEYIADEMQLPITVVKRWVSGVTVKLFPDGSSPLHRPKVSPAWGEEPAPEGEGLQTISSSRT